MSKGPFELEATELHLMDVGTPTHTGFDYDEELMELYAQNPELEGTRMGLVHSHNTMSTFFSEEDIDELRDNTTATDFMLSLIVNNDGLWTAKVAMRATTTITGTERITLFGQKTPLTRKIEINEEHLILTPLAVAGERDVLEQEEAFRRRITELNSKPFNYQASLFGYDDDYRNHSNDFPAKPAVDAEAFNKYAENVILQYRTFNEYEQEISRLATRTEIISEADRILKAAQKTTTTTATLERMLKYCGDILFNLGIDQATDIADELDNYRKELNKDDKIKAYDD